MQHFLGDPESRKCILENDHLTLAIVKRHWVKIALGMHRKPQTGNHLLSNQETECILRINNQKMGFKMGTQIQDCSS